MPIHPILADTPFADPAKAREWCALLESGVVLYFPGTPVPIPAEDSASLLELNPASSGHHKNIAYKPARDLLSGLDPKKATHAEHAQLHQIMRRYSLSVVEFLTGFLSPYSQRWQIDYASYRPFEEQGRSLPMHRRNDLLHTDAFPTRPTSGARILRFFHNIHPSRSRDWMISQPFAQLLDQFTPSQIPLPAPDNSFKRASRKLTQATGLGKLLPRLKRTPYDEYMLRLHDTMKEDAEFQQSCPKENFSFPPGSSWMVYTETVPHAVLAGQFALEQTLLIDPRANVVPASAPLSILEKRVGAPLA